MEPTTTPTDVSTTAIGLRYGLLTGLVNILISFALNALGQEQSPLRYLTIVVLVVGIVLAQRAYKQQHTGFMSYGEGIGIGAAVSAVVGALSAVFTYVYTTFVDPEIITRALEKARADMEAKGMSDAQIDQGMAISAKFTSGPVILIFALVGTILLGVLISLIVSAVLKNPKPEFE